MVDDSDLLPCPHCGSPAKSYHRPDDTGWMNTDWICCDAEECGAQTCLYESREQAVAAWNRRAGQAVTDEMVSAAEEVFFKTDDHGEPSYDMRAALKAAMEAGHGVHLHPHEVVV